MWITCAVRGSFIGSARLSKAVKPFAISRLVAMAGYAQNMWITLWETLPDPRGDAFVSALPANLASFVIVKKSSLASARATSVYNLKQQVAHGPARLSVRGR